MQIADFQVQGRQAARPQGPGNARAGNAQHGRTWELEQSDAQRSRKRLFGLLGCALVLGSASGAFAQPAEQAPDEEAAEAPQRDTGIAEGDALPAWALAPIVQGTLEGGGSESFILARAHDAPIFAARSTRAGRGVLRAGSIITGNAAGSSRGGCSGTWYRVGRDAFVCTHYGVRATQGQPAAPAHPRAADLSRPLPFRYARVADRSAHRFDHLPRRHHLESLANGSTLAMAERLDGDYFVALDGYADGPDGPYARTLDGHYINEGALEDVVASSFHGAFEASGLSLPMAFVFRDEVEAQVGEGEEATAESVARYHRFAIATEEVIEDVAYVFDEAGRRFHAEDLRIVRQREAPEEAGDGEQWIFVDLDAQTLTAYEGQTAVFATLIASGKPGYDTPAGVFRIRHKYVSTTMRGEDPNDGVYDVAEVPWTMYYFRSFALHGAYWHDAFGEVRSHGCTNISPIDARFLFRWSTPGLPQNWHGIRENGTWVQLYRESEEAS